MGCTAVEGLEVNGIHCGGVTIGIPLCNEESHVEAAIRSAASQCEAVWVSDNASTDRSAAICEGLARELRNVFFVRQTNDIGAWPNFEFVLDKAQTPYFMWLGAHDLIPETYVSRLKQLLELHPDAILAYGDARHVAVDGGEAGRYEYFYGSLLSDRLPATRLLGLIHHLTDCSLIHGLFRTEALRSAWVPEQYVGVDHVVLAKAVLLGRFLRAPEIALVRRDTHSGGTLRDQLERLTGHVADEVAPSRRLMESLQYALVVEVSKNQGWPRLWFRLKARLFLVYRFGPFGESYAERLFDGLLRVLRRIRRLAERTTQELHNAFKAGGLLKVTTRVRRG